MSSPELTPRPALGGMIVTWAFAALFALAAGLFAPEGQRFVWFSVGAGGCVLVAFAVNLASGSAHGFLGRTSAAAIGALAVMGVVGIVVFLVSTLSQISAL